jgi:hypothetical protein
VISGYESAAGSVLLNGEPVENHTPLFGIQRAWLTSPKIEPMLVPPQT